MYKLYKSNMYRYVTYMYTYIQYTYIYGYLCTVHGIYRLLAEILEPARELYYQHTILYMCDDVLPPVSYYIHTQAYVDTDTHGLLWSHDFSPCCFARFHSNLHPSSHSTRHPAVNMIICNDLKVSSFNCLCVCLWCNIS